MAGFLIVYNVLGISDFLNVRAHVTDPRCFVGWWYIPCAVYLCIKPFPFCDS